MQLSFPAALALLFIGLKLGGVIAWPWIWVLAPIWIPFAFALCIMLFAGLITLIAIAFR